MSTSAKRALVLVSLMVLAIIINIAYHLYKGTFSQEGTTVVSQVANVWARDANSCAISETRGTDILNRSKKYSHIRENLLAICEVIDCNVTEFGDTGKKYTQIRIDPYTSSIRYTDQVGIWTSVDTYVCEVWVIDSKEVYRVTDPNVEDRALDTALVVSSSILGWFKNSPILVMAESSDFGR